MQLGSFPRAMMEKARLYFSKIHPVIKMLLDTKNISLHEMGKDHGISFSNSNYTDYLVTRQIASGFSLCLMSTGVLASKGTAKHNSVKKEVVLLKAVKEVMFVIKLLLSLKASIKLTVAVRVDKIGAIMTATILTKHVDKRYKYVNEYVKDNIVKIEIVKCPIITATFL